MASRKQARSFEKQLYRGPKVFDIVNKRASNEYMRDAEKHLTTMKTAYGQLTQPHSRVERARLISQLNVAARQYIRTVDDMATFNEEMAQKIADLKAAHAETSVVPRAKENRNVLKSQIGRGNIDRALAKLQSAVDAHEESRERIAEFKDSGGFQALIDKHKAMADKYAHLDGSIPQANERMSLAEFQIAHQESATHHADQHANYKEFAGLLHNFGVAAGFEEERKKRSQ